MTEERRAGTYTHGYDPKMVEAMGARSAEREGAFFLSHLRPGMRLIDVGCGPGTITVGFASAVAPGEVLGIDVEPSMVEKARALADQLRLTNVRFEVGRAEELRAPDEAFDAAFEQTLLEHVANPQRVVEEMHRVLRPGGVIGLSDGDWGTLVVEPNVPELLEALALYERVWRHNGGDARLGRRQRALLRQAGFRRGGTTLWPVELFTPAEADDLVMILLAPGALGRAVELGWTDRATAERYAAGVRSWARDPDAVAIDALFQTIGWRD
jgi:ubiquinone/menaquinone biosynthesis C-methylase UbiE